MCGAGLLAESAIMSDQTTAGLVDIKSQLHQIRSPHLHLSTQPRHLLRIPCCPSPTLPCPSDCTLVLSAACPSPRRAPHRAPHSTPHPDAAQPCPCRAPSAAPPVHALGPRAPAPVPVEQQGGAHHTVGPGAKGRPVQGPAGAARRSRGAAGGERGRAVSREGGAALGLSCKDRGLSVTCLCEEEEKC